MDKIGPCKKCGGTNYFAKHVGKEDGYLNDESYKIKCRSCGHIVVSEVSAENAIKEWNTWETGPELPPDPNIPISPDGKFQIYRVQVKREGVHKIIYVVPCTADSTGHGDTLHDDLQEAIKVADFNRKKAEEREKREAEEKINRVKRIEEQKKREYMYGFGDDLPPIRKGKIIQHMQKVWNFTEASINKTMTMKDFIHFVYLQGNPEMKIITEKYDARGHERAEPKLTYCINRTEVGKIAYDYLQYLIKNKIKVEG